MNTLQQIFWPLICFFLGAWLLPPLWRRLRSGSTQVEAALTDRLREAEQSLAQARRINAEQASELETLRTTLAATETPLDAPPTLAETVAAAPFAELNEARQLLAATQTELAETQAALTAAQTQAATALETLQNQLAAAQAEAKTQLEAAHNEAASARATLAAQAPLVQQTEELQTTLAKRDTEIAQLLERIKTLAPLALQLKERDLRIKTLSEQLAASQQTDNTEADQLKAELSALQQSAAAEQSALNAKLAEQAAELKRAQNRAERLETELEASAERERALDNQLFELETKLKDNETERRNAIAQRDNEMQRMRLRLGELEGQAQLAAKQAAAQAPAAADAFRPEFEAQLRDQQTAHRLALGEKDAEVTRLRQRLSELEQAATPPAAAPSELAEQQLDSLKDKLKDKDAAIALLQLRVRELEPLGSQISDRDQQIKSLTVALDDAHSTQAATLAQLALTNQQLTLVARDKEQAVAQLETLRAAQQADAERSTAQLAELTAQLAAQQLITQPPAPPADQLLRRESQPSAREAQLQRALNEKEAALDKLSWRVGELEAFINNRDEQIGKLRWRIGELEPLGGQLVERDRQLAEREARVRATEAEHQRALATKDDELNTLRWRISELEILLEQGQPKPPATATTANPATAQALAEKEQQLQELQNRLRELESRTSSAAPASAAQAETLRQMETYQAAPPAEPDDLRQIHGVGPVLETLLHQLGIYFFHQVALWNDADIDFVNERLARFKGRIRRDNWVASARAAHLKKYGEEL